MNGFISASGQVKLAGRPVMGQAADVSAVAAGMAAGLDQQLAKLNATIATVMETERASLMKSAQDCATNIGQLRASTSDDDLRQKGTIANYCIGQLETQVAAAPKMAPGTAPAAATAPASTSGAPTWAYVIGGLALAGLVAFVATRK